MRKILLAMVIVLGSALAACGGDDDGGGGTTGATASETGATGATAEATGGASGATAATGPETDCADLTGEGPVFTIVMEKVAFVPNCFIASATQGISVVNDDPVLHSFTMVDTPIDVDVAAGETFNGEPISGVVAAGTYELICKYHASMVGEVTVVD